MVGDGRECLCSLSLPGLLHQERPGLVQRRAAGLERGREGCRVGHARGQRRGGDELDEAQTEFGIRVYRHAGGAGVPQT